MKLHNPTAEIFIPDGKPLDEALRRISHVGIGAHQDDLEFMAFHGILTCFHKPKLSFGGVTCTNGSGSARTGPYANFTDEQMMTVRRKEQNAAAVGGRYGAMIQLDHASKVVKNPADPSADGLRDDLVQILSQMTPQIVRLPPPRLWQHRVRFRHRSAGRRPRQPQHQ